MPLFNQTIPSKFSLPNNIPEYDLAEAPHDPENLLQEPWIDQGTIHSISGRGRGSRGRGRGRTRGGRSERRAVINSRSEAAQRSTTTNTSRFGQLLGWKGRSRGRGGAGRKRSRRTARSRQKPVKRVVDIGSSERDQQKESFFENTVTRSSDLQWNREETMGIQVEAAEEASSSSDRSDYDDYNGLAAGDEYDDDLLAGDYTGVFNGQPERLIEGVDYNVDVEEDDDDRPEEGDDVDVDDVDDQEEDDSEEDGQEDIDVERYINGDSDDEGNRDGGEQIGNPDDATESSSDYSE